MITQETTNDHAAHDCSVYHWDKQHSEYRCIDCDATQ